MKATPESNTESTPEPTPDYSNETELHQAVRNGKRKEVTLLCEKHNADPNAKNERWETPLHLACLYGHVAIVQFLVKYGADSDAKDIDGNSPIICLAQANREKAATIAGTLINRWPKGCDPHLLNNRGQSALHFAAMRGNADFCRTLIQVGLDPKQQDELGNSAIDYCTKEKCLEILEGPPPEISNNYAID